MIKLQIIFEGIRGSSYTGDIAIDEISFVRGSCRGEPVPSEDEGEDENTKGESKTIIGVKQIANKLFSFRSALYVFI